MMPTNDEATIREALAKIAQEYSTEATAEQTEIILAALSHLVAQNAEMRKALDKIAYNGLQAYCSDKCLCAARDMRAIAQDALTQFDKEAK